MSKGAILLRRYSLGLTHMLTDTKLRGLKPKAKVYRVADTNGLCIEVRTTGAKQWRYRYRYAGKPSMAALGEYPAMGLADARAERDRMRALVKGGANPGLSTSVGALLVACFALAHGYQHVVEMSAAYSLYAYCAGFAVSTVLILVSGLALGTGSTRMFARSARRWTGAVIATAGMYFIFAVV